MGFVPTNDRTTTADFAADFAADLAAHFADCTAQMARSAHQVGRAQNEICLLAISKTQPVAAIQALIDLGHRHFGENRVQEAAQKWPPLKAAHDGLELHLVGSLQSNKVKQAVELFDVIETLDREKLARALLPHKDKPGFPRLYIQVNTGAEPQKSGILPQNLAAFHALCTDMGLPIDGLMCVPPVGHAPGPHFALLGKLAAQIGVANLSMGMSGDFAVAIALGATHIRLGTALFGSREAQ